MASILIVEDEAIIAIDIAQTLETLGYDVFKAVASGEEAIELLMEQIPDLILMDIRLKGSLDGISTAEIINRKYKIPFIYLTTFVDDTTLGRAKKTNPYGYITKSFDKNSLHSTIEMALYRHHIEVQAMEAEEMLSITLKSISDAVIGASVDGTIISWNLGAEKIFGYRMDEVNGKNLSILVPDYFPNEMPEIIDKVVNGEDIDHYETIRQKKDGTIIHLSQKISTIRDARNRIKGVSIIGRDISARTALEKQITEVGERERKRIGQDLHDSLGQQLTGISLRLRAMAKRVEETSPEEKNELEEIQELVKQAIMQTRELAKGLIPITLNSEGLPHALKELCSLAESISNINVEQNINEKIMVTDMLLATQLYHIAQEAMNNVQKHARAEKITMSLYEEESDLVLSIKDEGKGLHNSEAAGIGFKIMQYRANMINARLTIFSPDTGGTSVVCRVPFQTTKGKE
ncbi:MAG: PAS domain S-box protein [Spirochaetales bacterium]|nr:PAS domain S-box protein [Spirochaetales bacterium]